MGVSSASHHCSNSSRGECPLKSVRRLITSPKIVPRDQRSTAHVYDGDLMIISGAAVGPRRA